MPDSQKNWMLVLQYSKDNRKTLNKKKCFIPRATHNWEQNKTKLQTDPYLKTPHVVLTQFIWKMSFDTMDFI